MFVGGSANWKLGQNDGQRSRKPLFGASRYVLPVGSDIPAEMPVTLRLFRRLGGMKWLNLVALFGIGAAAGCGNAADREAPTAESASPGENHQRSEAPERSAPTSASQSREGAGPPPAAWVQRRVAQAEARLGESEAGRVLAQAIDAHGGLRRWLQAGNVSFFFDYRSLTDASRRMNTHQRVDLWSSRAVHESRQGEVRFGWDGQAAWIEPSADAFLCMF